MTIRAPLLSGKRPRKVQTPQIFPNLLVTTLAVVAAIPFSQLDWPNPLSRPHVQSLQVGSSYALIGEAGEKPFAQTEWPNPAVSKVQQAFQGNNLLTLPGEKPFEQSDWINPTSLPTQQPSQLPKSIALIEAVAPFAQTEWPLPTLDVEIQAPFHLGSPYALIGDAGEKPFAQTEWPNPQVEGVQKPQDLQLPLSLVVAPVQPPFFQIDWPNPTVVTLVQTPFQLGASYALIGEAGDKPFAQTDWPNPTVARKVQTPFQVGSAYVLIGEAGEKPFFQNDWITPPGIPTQTPVQLSVSPALEEAPPIVAAAFTSRHIAPFFN